jgi:hypothetical protein
VRRFCEPALATIATTAAVLGIGLGTPAAGIAASPYQQVLRVYEREATIPPCQFTSVQLQAALAGVDSYGAQYFADFTQAIQSALTSRAAGECSGSSPGGGGAASGGVGAAPGGGAAGSGGGNAASGRGPTAIDGSGPGRAAPLGPLTAATSSGVPAPLLALAALAVVLAVLAAVLNAARWRGPESVWSRLVTRLRW